MTVCLVLGGGGSRGLAHIGVLKVLEEHDIPIDCIVGTSMGAIVGSLYSLGLDLDKIAERMKAMQNTSLFSLKMFSARARQQSVQDLLEPALGGKTFDDLTIPLTVMAVDMVTGTEIGISEGPLIPAILATSAVPAVFPPVEIGDMLLLDGGVIDSVCTEMAHKLGADKIIAVDVHPPLSKDDPWMEPLVEIVGFQLPFNLSINNIPSMSAAIWRSVRVMATHVHEARLKQFPPDVLIRPTVEDYGSLDFKDVTGPIEAGIVEAERHLDALLALKPR
ncbi:MAG: patatin-like phospholipase family protein [Chloroflexi bacterium]|nr:patatin-like phospholipase family protein [Chloroflexota bacterium]